jgi:hypothetical protein
MATSRVVHGRRGAAKCYSGRIFGDCSRYVSTDYDSLAADVAAECPPLPWRGRQLGTGLDQNNLPRKINGP